jgi:DNA-binding HxlR family transcriptional regulator
MKRTRFDSDICAIARTLDVIGDWWSVLIIRDALGGVRRFSDFQQKLGAAKNVLTTRLKELVAAGILKTGPASDGTAYREYLPTEKAQALLPVLVALAQWGSENLFDKGETCSVPVDAANRRPLAPIKLHARDGRVLSASDILMTKFGKC